MVQDLSSTQPERLCDRKRFKKIVEVDSSIGLSCFLKAPQLTARRPLQMKETLPSFLLSFFSPDS